MEFELFLEGTVVKLFQLARAQRDTIRELEDELKGYADAELIDRDDEKGGEVAIAPEPTAEMPFSEASPAEAAPAQAIKFQTFRISPGRVMTVGVVADTVNPKADASAPRELYNFLSPYLSDAFLSTCRSHGLRLGFAAE